MSAVSEQEIHELNQIMGAEVKDKTIMAEAILKFLQDKSEKKQKELLNYVLENFGYVPESLQKLSNRGLSDESWKFLENSGLEEALDSIYEYLHQKRLQGHINRQPLMQMVWDLIFHLPDQQEKIFLLSKIIYGPLLPMVFVSDQPGAVSMTNQEFNRLFQEIEQQLYEIFELKKAGFQYWPQMAQAIIPYLKNEKDISKRAVLMSAVLVPIHPDLSNPIPEGKNNKPLSDVQVGKIVSKLDKELLHIKKLLASPYLHQETQYGGAISEYLLNFEKESEQIVLLALALSESAKQSQPQMGMIAIGSEGIKVVGAMPPAELITSLILSDFLSGDDAFDPEKCASCDEVTCPEHPQNKDQEKDKKPKPIFVNRTGHC